MAHEVKPAQGWTLPDDWDGESWTCIQVQIPDSWWWRQIVRGLLFTLTRGREWDSDTTRVKDAQVIGWQVFDRNEQLFACTEAGSCDDEIQEYIRRYIGGYGDLPEGDCEEMGCRAPCIRWNKETGKLEVFDCGAWVEVPEVGEGDDDNDPKNDPNPDPDNVSYACRKAYGLANRYFDFMESVLDVMDEYPWNWAKALRTANADLEFGAVRAFNLVAEYKVATTLLNDWFSVELSITEREQLVCLWAKVMDNETSTLSDEEIAAMKGVVKQFNWGQVENSFAKDCFDFIGKANWNRIAAASVKNEDANCDCPDPVDPDNTLPDGVPVTRDWIHDFRFWENNGNFVGGLNASYISSLGWQSETQFFYIEKGGQGTSYPTFLYVEFYIPTGSTGEQAYHMNMGAELNESDTPFVVGWNKPSKNLPGTVAGNGIHFDMGNSVPPSGGRKYVKRIVVAGNGDDPFPS